MNIESMVDVTELITSLEAGLSLEQIASFLQQQTSNILYIEDNKLHNVGIFDDMYDHFRDEGEQYEIVAIDETIPCWTLKQQKPVVDTDHMYMRYKPRYYKFFDKTTVDDLLDKDDDDE